MTNNFTTFSAKKTWNYLSIMLEHIYWKFLLNTWVISIRVHKYGFVLLNRLEYATNTVFSDPRTANYWKMSKKKVSLKASLQIHCYMPLLNWSYSKPTHKRKNLDFIFIGSNVTTQTRLKITLWPIDANAKNVMIFGFLVSRAFQRYIIRMISHSAVIIFSRYYSLIFYKTK